MQLTIVNSLNFFTLFLQEYVDMGELISPMQPHAAQNEAIVPSSPSDSESVASSVFENDEHCLEHPLKTIDTPIPNSIHLPIIHEVTC
jgi:hypothetical protein